MIGRGGRGQGRGSLLRGSNDHAAVALGGTQVGSAPVGGSPRVVVRGRGATRVAPDGGLTAAKGCGEAAHAAFAEPPHVDASERRRHGEGHDEQGGQVWP